MEGMIDCWRHFLPVTPSADINLSPNTTQVTEAKVSVNVNMQTKSKSKYTIIVCTTLIMMSLVKNKNCGFAWVRHFSLTLIHNIKLLQ